MKSYLVKDITTVRKKTLIAGNNKSALVWWVRFNCICCCIYSFKIFSKRY